MLLLAMGLAGLAGISLEPALFGRRKKPVSSAKRNVRALATAPLYLRERHLYRDHLQFLILHRTH